MKPTYTSIPDCLFEGICQFGNVYYEGASVPQNVTDNLEKQNRGSIRYMWLPRIDHGEESAELQNSNGIGCPLIWSNLDDGLYIVPLRDLLPTHSVFLENELNQIDIQKTYPHHALEKITKFIQQWKCDYDKDKKQIKVELNKFSKGQLILLNSATLPFAKQNPVAKIQHVYKRKIEQNVKIIQMRKNQAKKIIPINHSSCIINHSDIIRILSSSTEQQSRQLAFTELELKNQKCKSKKYKKRETEQELDRMDETMINYFGKKIKASLNKNNFVKNRDKQKPTRIEQEANSKDVKAYTYTLNDKEINYQQNARNLTIDIENPMQLGTIIGSQNVMNMKDGYEYFIEYPFQIRYSFNLKFPRFITQYNVLRKNLAGNVEK